MPKISILPLKNKGAGLPGCPAVKTLSFHCRDTGSIPGWGAEITHGALCNQEKKKSKAKQKHRGQNKGIHCFRVCISLSLSLHFFALNF